MRKGGWQLWWLLIRNMASRVLPLRPRYRGQYQHRSQHLLRHRHFQLCLHLRQRPHLDLHRHLGLYIPRCSKRDPDEPSKYKRIPLHSHLYQRRQPAPRPRPNRHQLHSPLPQLLHSLLRLNRHLPEGEDDQGNHKIPEVHSSPPWLLPLLQMASTPMD